MQSKTAIGAFIRRIKTRLGAPTAINAGAHKLARLLHRMLKFGKAYVETGQEAYEKLFKERSLRNLQRRAREFGFDVTPIASTTALVSWEDENMGGQPARQRTAGEIVNLFPDARRSFRRDPTASEPARQAWLVRDGASVRSLQNGLPVACTLYPSS